MCDVAVHLKRQKSPFNKICKVLFHHCRASSIQLRTVRLCIP